jgi:hypothetical protein
MRRKKGYCLTCEEPVTNELKGQAVYKRYYLFELVASGHGIRGTRRRSDERTEEWDDGPSNRYPNTHEVIRLLRIKNLQQFMYTERHSVPPARLADQS